MKQLRQAVAEGSFILDLKARNLPEILHQALNNLVARGKVAADRRDMVEAALLEREAQAGTAIGNTVAVPHVYLEEFDQPSIVFIRLAHAINLGAPDGLPTRFLFVLLGPPGKAVEHLDTLANIARLTADEEFLFDAEQAATKEELLAALAHFHERTTPRPEPSAPTVTDGLKYTGRLAGGLLNDVRRRLPHYRQDFIDGLHPKCVSSIIFLYFACLAPSVMFGGVMAKLTDGSIGVVEMLAATALCGVTYALLSGQPLAMLGGTGPMLIYTMLLFRLCVDLKLPFLPTYAWVGLWSAGMTLLLAVTDASCLMRYFTRFTNEIFAALISLIFIYEAVTRLIEIFQGLEVKRHHDTALLSVLLALGTFYIAMNLTGFRRSRYLLPQMREFLADFGPAIALGSMTLVAVWMHEVFLDVLPAPEHFQPTLETAAGVPRPWLVDLWAVPIWVRVAAFAPALLGTVLIFLDQNITVRLINSPENKLQKGEAYHQDLAVVGGLVGICSLLGFPWLVAATVRSLNHLRSLATLEEAILPSGETRERVRRVRENRVTPLMIHALIGFSLLLLPYLRQIPMAVLYGLFLYMGVVSMRGNQFFERMSLWFMDSSLYPSTHYMRRVPNLLIHAYTAIQAVCLTALWLVKISPVGILFPLLIALLVPLRLLIGKFMPHQYLEALDAEEEPEEEENTWF